MLPTLGYLEPQGKTGILSMSSGAPSRNRSSLSIALERSTWAGAYTRMYWRVDPRHDTLSCFALVCGGMKTAPECAGFGKASELNFEILSELREDLRALHAPLPRGFQRNSTRVASKCVPIKLIPVSLLRESDRSHGLPEIERLSLLCGSLLAGFGG